MNLIYDYDLKDLQNYLVDNGLKPFRARQIFKWLYEKRVSSFEQMSDISKDLQAKLNEDFCFNDLQLVKRQISKDGTQKFLFKLFDGCLVESVLMVFDYGFSACLSSQVGCNMGCTFCASGLLKKQRDLSPGEIVLQALTIQKYLDETQDRLGNIVLMGTGEPFDNYDNVMKALSIINDPFGLQIGARHISVSTCGVVPMIRKFALEDKQYNLAISLHAPNNELRSKLMPINKAYPLEELFAALKDYASSNNRRLTFEYLLLQDINDSKKEADELKNLLSGLNAYVNLIPYNEVNENQYHTASAENALRFYDLLKKNNVAVTLRQKKGDDIDAACGQLRANNLK
ncbi:MAG: 23S rRNA (adenine(2503)-C(2))-methyltransferase RlmN [Erysipelotrichaceae bacterium]|nr:23S rRNA (adenine(2503)-C(2))-methyltransferase RlmN [Erysipelotrichaceae bacterium]